MDADETGRISRADTASDNARYIPFMHKNIGLGSI